MQDIFVEQLGNIVVGANVVRLDFMRVEATEAGKPGRLQPGLRVVIPLASFAQAVDAMNTLRDKLISDGVLVRNAKIDTPAAKT